MAENEKTTPENGETQNLTTVSSDTNPRDVSALTIAHLMGLTTVTDLKLMESKLDLISTKIMALTTRFDRLFQTTNTFVQSTSNFATGADLERVDVQIGSLKTMIKDLLSGKDLDEPINDQNDTLKKIKSKIFAKKEEGEAQAEQPPADQAAQKE